MKHSSHFSSQLRKTKTRETSRRRCQCRRGTGTYKKMEGEKRDDFDASGDTLTSKERMISESPVMWPEQPFCKYSVVVLFLFAF